MTRLFESRKDTIVSEDGEVISTTTTTSIQSIKAIRPKSFVNLLIDGAPLLFSLSGAELKLFLAVAVEIDYEGNVDLSTSKRRDICGRLGIKPKSFGNTLSKLKKEDYLRELDGSRLVVNPTVVHKGPLKDIAKRIREYEETSDGSAIAC